jgi:hypothetical protein
LHVLHISATLHRLQLKLAGQDTHPTPFVELQVYDARQHPGAPAGCIYLLALHVLQMFALSHRVQVKFAKQETHPTPLTLLHVYSDKQQPIEIESAGKK